MNQQNQAMGMMNCSMTGLSIQTTGSGGASGTIAYSNSASGGSAGVTNSIYYGDPPNTAWGYWQQYYYPQVILQSYPVYLQNKAMDKGKQAFEICKSLLDKKLIKLDKVSDFVEAMDTILKTL